MKTTRYFGFLILLLSGLFFIQCTSDPIAGPPGIPGVDGTDGKDGVDGVDGTASCVACHSDSHRDPIHDSYAVSKHANPSRLEGRSSCARCHSNEGYILYTSGFAIEENIENVTPISCKTCHDSHSTFDFENDGHDYALRTLDPVSLIIDDTYVIDFGNTSNNCAECHQPRRTLDYYLSDPDDFDPVTGLLTITSSHMGPHHSSQVTVFEGIGGEFIAGSTPYPGTGSSTHYTASSCVDCHMAAGTETEGKEGQHSWHTNVNSCNSCHTNGAPVMDDLIADIATLEGLLDDLGVYHDGHVVTGTTVNVTQAKALWNFLTVIEDQSNGVHNPAYTRALIKNSIEALEQ